jgi:hypothetical protein
MPVLRHTTVTLALCLFATPSAWASTVIVCELQGKVLSASVNVPLKPVDAKSPALTGSSFAMQVSDAKRPKEGRADGQCTEFMDRKVDVVLHVPLVKPLNVGDAVSVRYRYLDGSRSRPLTSYELIDRP